jgi:hypothetical protein
MAGHNFAYEIRFAFGLLIWLLIAGNKSTVASGERQNDLSHYVLLSVICSLIGSYNGDNMS